MLTSLNDYHYTIQINLNEVSGYDITVPARYDTHISGQMMLP